MRNKSIPAPIRGRRPLDFVSRHPITYNHGTLESGCQDRQQTTINRI